MIGYSDERSGVSLNMGADDAGRVSRIIVLLCDVASGPPLRVAGRSSLLLQAET